MTAPPVSTLSTLVPDGKGGGREALHAPTPGYSRACLCSTSARVSQTQTRFPRRRGKQHDVPGLRKSPTRHRTSPHTTGTAVEYSTAAWRDPAASVACLPLAPPTPARRRCRRLSTIGRGSGASCRTLARCLAPPSGKTGYSTKKRRLSSGHEKLRCFIVYRAGCDPRTRGGDKQRCLCFRSKGRGSIQAPSGFSRASHHGGDERDKVGLQEEMPGGRSMRMTKI